MLVFPATPAVNALFPDPAIGGVPQWQWDGIKWRSVGVSGSFVDAPSDGTLYGREDGAWTEIPVPSTTPGFRNLLMHQTATTPVSSVDIFYPFSSTFDQYEIDIMDLRFSGNAAALQMFLSIDGSTFLTGTGNYRYAWYYANSAAGYAGGGGNNTFVTGNMDTGPGGVGRCMSLITFMKPWQADGGIRTFMAESTTSLAGPNFFRYSIGVAFANYNDPILGIRFRSSTAANITAGTFNMYGITKVT